MHVDLTNWKILPSPSKKTLPLSVTNKQTKSKQTTNFIYGARSMNVAIVIVVKSLAMAVNVALRALFVCFDT